MSKCSMINIWPRVITCSYVAVFKIYRCIIKFGKIYLSVSKLITLLKRTKYDNVYKYI